eukprot:CAMPEP_0197600782 /NCGR_PEP_ID=MMETSP1326-20131121/33979_1 /TAXON_ID=1155430 /ORGANISM="Genus nov. species nov., Strain RCC2288" /LENGTH=54 /DNA_ID=CAMNT_0043167919 /DNA_START=260 /DNA_END=420 /DNA_ORIENTATION=-
MARGVVMAPGGPCGGAGRGPSALAPKLGELLRGCRRVGLTVGAPRAVPCRGAAA